MRRTDPVCGRPVNPDGAPTCEADGRQHWFCSEACRRQFLETHRAGRRGRDVPAEVIAEAERDARWWHG